MQILLCFDISQPGCSRDLSPGALPPLSGRCHAAGWMDGLMDARLRQLPSLLSHSWAASRCMLLARCLKIRVEHAGGGDVFACVSRCMNSQSSENGDEC